MKGEEIDEEELNQMTLDEVKDELDSYTSTAEKWANHVLTSQKMEFNVKEKGDGYGFCHFFNLNISRRYDYIF
jgi:hypothetical protein